MFSPKLTVVLQLLLLLKAANATGTDETPSATSAATARKSPAKPTLAPTTSKATTMATSAPNALATVSPSNCATPLGSGALAGIIVVVILIYLLSLLLTAFLVSHFTKKGTLDLDRLIFNRLPFLKKGRNARESVNLPQNQEVETNEYVENRPSSVYTGLQIPDPNHSPTDDSMYTALQDVRRLPSDSSEQPASGNSLALPKEGRQAASPSPTTPKPRSHKRDETKLNAKPKIIKEKPKTTKVVDNNDDEVYQNV